MGQLLLVLLLISFISTLLLATWVRGRAQQHANAYPADAVQRFHFGDVPRLGGLAMLMGFSVSLLYAVVAQHLGYGPNVELSDWDAVAYIGCLAGPVLIGVWEDITHRVSVVLRLFITASGALLAVWLLDAHIGRLGISWLDDWWGAYPFLGVALTIFAIAGLPHAFNIIDGYNGLAGLVTIVISGALVYMALKFGDRQLATYALCTLASTAGFLIWNYPRGLLFAGDGGAYFWGLNIAIICILLVERHAQVSPWFVILLLVYPVWETVFSIARKTLQGVPPSMADSLHLHHMIYRRIVRTVFHEDEAQQLLSKNNRTAPYLVGLTILTVLPALIFWQNTPILMGFCLLFVTSYVTTYLWLTNHKLVKWLRKRLR